MNYLGPGILLGGGVEGVDVLYIGPDGERIQIYDRIKAMMDAETIYAHGYNQLSWGSHNCYIYANQDETNLDIDLESSAGFMEFGKDLPWAFV